VPLILLTSRVIEKNMNDALAKIEALTAIEGQVIKIRMEHLG
jgi:homoserine dehydrogenase